MIANIFLGIIILFMFLYNCYLTFLIYDCKEFTSKERIGLIITLLALTIILIGFYITYNIFISL